MRNSWRVYWWAMLHSPEFQYCYIKNPITVGFRWFKDYSSWSLSFGISLQSLDVYVPWSVRNAFCKAHKEDPETPEFDDIPF